MKPEHPLPIGGRPIAQAQLRPEIAADENKFVKDGVVANRPGSE